MKEYIAMWKNFANFGGNASVRDYWMAFLINMLVSFAVGLVAGIKRTSHIHGRPLCLRYLFSRPVTRQLSSAYVCLTSVFGMGPGGPTRQSTRTLCDGFLTHLIMSKARRLLTTTL